MANEHNTPNLNPKPKANQQYIDLCKNVYAGSTSCKKYLKQATGESDEGFKERQRVATLNQTFYKGIRSIIDIIFRKELTFSDDMPEKIKEMYKTADSKNTLNTFAKDMLRDMLLTNRSYILVWTPPNRAKNKKEEVDLGIRPYLQLIDRDRVIFLDGEKKAIAISGTYKYNIGRYGCDVGVEHKIYFEDGMIEVWRDDKKVKDVQLKYKGLTIVESVLDNNEIDMPMFADEAMYQLSHFNMESNRKAYGQKLLTPNIISWGMLQSSKNIATETTDKSGDKVYKVDFGANRGINFPINPENGARLGDVEFKELSGNSDKIARDTLEDDLESIRKGFIELVSNESKVKTVSQTEAEKTSGESQLSSIASTIESTLNKIHILMCELAGETPRGEIIVNKEFTSHSISDLQYQILSDLSEKEFITKKTFLELLAEAGTLKGIDIEDEMKKLEAGL